MTLPEQPTTVTVLAPARLHMGFVDLSGSLGRHFGSIGIALNELGTRITVNKSSQRKVSGASAQRAEQCLAQLCQVLNVSDALDIQVESAIPEHVGLGSGTQMALAIGSALNAFYGLGLSVREIAAVMDRGLRSGIGIGVFEQGGLIVDGGRGAQTITPPVLVRLNVPEDWRFILVFDSRGQGLHGLQEIQAFKKLPPFPQQEAQRLCYRLLMQALPAVSEANLPQFGEVITELQRSVGEHFAPVQGGVFASGKVAKVMAWLAQQGCVAIGQTSWGPTGFCAVAQDDLADTLVAEARRQFSDTELSFSIVSARNGGGVVGLSDSVLD